MRQSSAPQTPEKYAITESKQRKNLVYHRGRKLGIYSYAGGGGGAGKGWSLLALASRGRNLARAHEVPNVFLQEFVVVVELVVLLLDDFDSVDDGKQRVL